MLIDTHCHLYFDKFAADRAAALDRMAETGVGGAVVIGIDAASCEQAFSLAAEHPHLRYSVGQHPADPIAPDFDARAALAPYFRRSVKPVAIGECGLDLHWDVNPLARQCDALRQQLELARDLDVPAVIHTRAADADTAAMLAAAADTVCVLHCFNGSELLLELALKRGFYVSFAGNLTFPKAAELRSAALRVPDELLLVETDAPFLAPQPVRGQRCEPAHVAHTARALAELRGLPLTRLADILYANTCRCFKTQW